MNIYYFRPICLFALSAGLFSATAFRHWDNPEKYLIHYHDSGKYYQDLSNVIKEATFYLQFRITQNDRTHHKQKLAIVMDIDETALSNYRKLQQAAFHVSNQTFHHLIAKGDNPAIPYTLTLYNYAKHHGVHIFFITGRNRAIATLTQNNLKQVGYHGWRHISFPPSNINKDSDTVQYRIQQRQQIHAQGYDIIMNIGNRKTTLTGGYADMIFKLPNPFYKL